jgi:hypothetical protein
MKKNEKQGPSGHGLTKRLCNDEFSIKKIKKPQISIVIGVAT